MTFRKALWTGEYILSQAHIEDPKTDAWILLETVCKIDRTYYFMHQDDDRCLQRERKECRFNILQVTRSSWDCILQSTPMC